MSDSVTVEESVLAAVSDVGDAFEACSLNRDTSTLVEFTSWRSLLEQPTRAFSFLPLHA